MKLWTLPAYNMGAGWYSIVLLLCLMPAQSVTNMLAPRTGYACEGSTLTIDCAVGHLIKILRANYGRLRRVICNEGDMTQNWDMHCMSTRSLRIVTQLCLDRASCDVLATNRMFGDPCPQVPKYLEVQYKCAPAVPRRPPHVSISPERVHVDAGGTVTLTCTTGGEPVPNVHWTHRDGSRIPQNSTRLSGTVLILRDMRHSATYTCVAENRVGTTSATATVIVRATPTIPAMITTVGPEMSTGAHTTDMFTRETVTTTSSRLSCSAIEMRDISWPDTPSGTLMRKKCPNNDNVYATWYCGTDPVQWVAIPDLSMCVSQKMLRVKQMILQAQAGVFNSIVEEVADDIMHISAGNLYGGDVTMITDVMGEVVNRLQSNMAQVKNVTKVVLKTSSNLLDQNKTKSWLDLPQATQAKAATDMVNTLEESAFHLADTMEADTVKVSVDVNIVLQVNVIGTNRQTVNDVAFSSHDPTNTNSITLPGKAIKELGLEGLAKLIFVTYNNLEQFLKPETKRQSNVIVKSDEPLQRDEGYIQMTGDKEGNNDAELPNQIVNTQVVSASINKHHSTSTQLAEPILYTLQHKTTENIYNPTCSFWEFSEMDMKGRWSQFGCQLVTTNVTHTTCSCEHLTNFAVLMDISGTPLSDSHMLALQLITYIGCSISIFCLLLSWLTFQFLKNLQCDRNTIHKNLVFCLFVAEVIFLTGIAQHHRPLLCSIVAGLLHYFFLASFAWMCLEGVQLYLMLVEVFEAERSRSRYFYLVGYGVPAIIVIVSAAVDYRGYGTENHCWLRTETGFIWSFVGPAALVMLINIAMLSVAIYTMCKHAASTAAWKMKEKSRLENISEKESDADSSSIQLSWLKGATVLVVLLGLTWAFGFLYVDSRTKTLAYVFTVFNSLQGLFIFIFHCVMTEKVQKEYKRCVRRTHCLPECIRVRYGGAQAAYTSSSPNHSTTSGTNYLQKLLRDRRKKRLSTTSLQKSSQDAQSNRWQRDKEQQLSPDERYAEDSMLHRPLPERPDDYLVPVSQRVSEYDELDDHCHQEHVPLNVDKYKIDGTRARLASDEDDEHEQNRLNNMISDDSLLRRKLNALGDDDSPTGSVHSNHVVLELQPQGAGKAANNRSDATVC